MRSTRQNGEDAGVGTVSENEPLLEFPGVNTPYIDYQSITTLLSLQHPRSNTAAEMAFYIIGQVKELLFKLLYEEVVVVRTHLDADDVPSAIWHLRRARRVVDLLTNAWDVLATLSPNEFNSFREFLGQASGVQSYMYRMVEYVLGNKNAALGRPHRGVAGVHEQVQRALSEPSVYDATVAHLARSDFPIPREVLDRASVESHRFNKAVQGVWETVYRSGNPGCTTFQLAEALMDLAEGFCRWRAIHLLTVERIIGTKAGTGGTQGVSWLRRAAEQRPFPELWAARSCL